MAISALNFCEGLFRDGTFIFFLQTSDLKLSFLDHLAIRSLVLEDSDQVGEGRVFPSSEGRGILSANGPVGALVGFKLRPYFVLVMDSSTQSSDSVPPLPHKRVFVLVLRPSHVLHHLL